MQRRGVWVTGPSRSGTSMVAGFFAQHGVFFGACNGANEYNPKGYFENQYLKDVAARDGLPGGWPRLWFDALSAQGWDGATPWGAKIGPGRAWLMLPMRPSVIVACHRPIEQIVRSRRRVKWAKGPPRKVARNGYQQIAMMEASTRIPVVHVQTDELVKGRMVSVLPAFAALGVTFDLSIATAWIDPSIWGRG